MIQKRILERDDAEQCAYDILEVVSLINEHKSMYISDVRVITLDSDGVYWLGGDTPREDITDSLHSVLAEHWYRTSRLSLPMLKANNFI
jgi:hypothetical protein